MWIKNDEKDDNFKLSSACSNTSNPHPPPEIQTSHGIERIPNPHKQKNPCAQVY